MDVFHCSTCSKYYKRPANEHTFYFSTASSLFFCSEGCANVYYINPLAYENTPRDGYLVTSSWYKTFRNLDNKHDS